MDFENQVNDMSTTALDSSAATPTEVTTEPVDQGSEQIQAQQGIQPAGTLGGVQGAPQAPQDASYWQYVAQQQALALQSTQAQMEQLAVTQVAQQLRGAGYDDQQVAQVLQQLGERAQFQREQQALQSQRQALQTPAKLIAAQRLSEAFSKDGLTIKPEELMGSTSPEAMETRARTLHEAHRRYTLGQRAQQGVDSTPGESSGGQGKDDNWWMEGSSRSVWDQAFSRKRGK